MTKTLLATAAFILLVSSGASQLITDDAATGVDKDLAHDLKLMQGTWEQFHGNDGEGKPNTRSVKTIEGNKETIRRYSIKTGKLGHEHVIEFKLSKSGSVRVFTFFRVGGSPKNGSSYVYKVDKKNFYDIPGLLHGDEYRNYQQQTTIWHWKRIPKTDAAKSTTNSDKKPAN